jgi:hypothetical protein
MVIPPVLASIGYPNRKTIARLDLKDAATAEIVF